MLKNRLLLMLLSTTLMLTMTPFMVTPASAAKKFTEPMVAAGYHHSLALRDDGTVWAWGNNEVGQLGNGESGLDASGFFGISSTAPVRVLGGESGEEYLTNVKTIAAGDYYSLAIKDNGTVWSWGYNHYGQLGNGKSGEGVYNGPVYSPTPIQVLGEGGKGYLTDVKALAGGYDHTIALKNDGTVWGWGYNRNGQLGNKANADRTTTPVKMKGEGGKDLTDVVAIAAGGNHSIVLKDDGTVWACGWNSFGQLGNGTKVDSNVLVQVKGEGGEGNLTGVKAISAGDYHFVALKYDGTVWAWGCNDNGQLGDGKGRTYAYSLFPTPVLGEGGEGNLTGVAAIASGKSHSFAIKDDGTVWAWGWNQFGQLGNGESGYVAGGFLGISSTTPVKVLGADGKDLTDVKAFAARAGWHSIVLKNDGTVLSWGCNYGGQLGDGTIDYGFHPVPVLTLGGEGGVEFLNLYSTPDLTPIAAGADHSLALDSNGTVWACGKNSFGQLGDGTKTNRPIAAQVLGLSDVAHLKAGSYHSLALDGNGIVWSWGRNSSGQLGNGTKTNRTAPVPVQKLSGVTAIAAGCSHSLALDSNGTVWAWGRNNAGQLGDGTKTSRLTPVKVSELSGVTAIAAGGDYSLALVNGKVFAWGSNKFGQLGDGTKTNRLIPVQVEELSGVKAIAAGGYHSSAIKEGGTALAWGRNNFGQLGDGTKINRLIPTPVVNLTAKAITAGWYHTLALGSDDTVLSWGRNSSGQLGNGTTKGSLTPEKMFESAKTLAAGAGHSLALGSDDTVLSWGRNSSGQLGDGTTNMRSMP
jgi:alpha-tubulin suppressor-like RCC1 family protein